MSVRTGSCLCGGVKAELRGEPFMKNLCHCTSCQKITGGVFGSLASYKTEQVTFTESEPSVLKTYTDTSPESGAVLWRSFCGRCGGPVRAQRASHPGILAIPVGFVDGDKAAFRPQLELFCRGRADWVGAVVADPSKAYDTLPVQNFDTMPAAANS